MSAQFDPITLDLLKEKERICRMLGNTEGVCISRVNQGAVYAKMGQPEKHIQLLEDALALAREHKLHRLAGQIEAILKKLRADEAG